jgi:hypothetical protein
VLEAERSDRNVANDRQHVGVEARAVGLHVAQRLHVLGVDARELARRPLLRGSRIVVPPMLIDDVDAAARGSSPAAIARTFASSFGSFSTGAIAACSIAVSQYAAGVAEELHELHREHLAPFDLDRVRRDQGLRDAATIADADAQDELSARACLEHVALRSGHSDSSSIAKTNDQREHLVRRREPLAALACARKSCVQHTLEISAAVSRSDQIDRRRRRNACLQPRDTSDDIGGVPDLDARGAPQKVHALTAVERCWREDPELVEALHGRPLRRRSRREHLLRFPATGDRVHVRARLAKLLVAERRQRAHGAIDPLEGGALVVVKMEAIIAARSEARFRRKSDREIAETLAAEQA